MRPFVNSWPYTTCIARLQSTRALCFTMDELEIIQKRALQIVFPLPSYAEAWPGEG